MKTCRIVGMDVVAKFILTVSCVVLSTIKTKERLWFAPCVGLSGTTELLSGLRNENACTGNGKQNRQSKRRKQRRRACLKTNFLKTTSCVSLLNSKWKKTSEPSSVPVVKGALSTMLNTNVSVVRTTKFVSCVSKSKTTTTTNSCSENNQIEIGSQESEMMQENKILSTPELWKSYRRENWDRKTTTFCSN